MLMKLVGMLITKDGEISSCDYDVTGLFETVDDLKSAPRIIEDLMAIDFYREYVVKLRGGKLTVMMGYSDSVRDGSSLAADSQVIRTAMALKSLEEILNSKYDTQPRLEFIYYRGRGDTIPRGFGGSITKAIGSQLITRRAEDHTEQNRYLRVYASVPSAVHHFHSVYSAHISSQVNVSPGYLTCRTLTVTIRKLTSTLIVTNHTLSSSAKFRTFTGTPLCAGQLARSTSMSW